MKRVRRGDQVHEYVQLVEGRRVDGKVRQRVVATLGRLDELKASGQLDRWAGAFARLDPPPVGTRREVGPLLLVAHYLRRLGLVELVDAAAPMRGKSLLTHGEVIAALVANRLSAPAPLYDVSGWAGQAAIAELLKVPAGLLGDDRLGRALEAFHPVAEDLRGRLLLTTLDTFDVDASRLHLDLTTIRFAGAYPDSTLVKKGWGSDRRVARQVRTLQACTPDGVALYLRPHKGSEAELTCLGQALETLQALTPPGLIIVADSAFGHLGSLCAADRKGLRFVVPLRADTGWADSFDRDVPAGLAALSELDHVAERERHLAPERATHWRGLLTAFAVTDPKQGSHHDMSVAYIWSSEEATSVTDARERALTKAEADLTRVRNGLGGRYYKTIEQVRTKVARIVHPRITPLLHVQTGTDSRGKPTLSWHRDQRAITTAARLDGLYALATNLPGPLTATDVLDIYKDQWIVEQRHRDLKRPAPLRVRPVFLHNDDRIDALIGVVGIALLIFGLIEADLRHRLPTGQERLPGLLPEGRAAKPTGRNILAAFNNLGFTYTTAGPVLDRLTTTQRQILALLDIQLPWIEQTD
ncbi:MAG TPA: IS1634 family transposase [Dermatophilaceae bacterium]